MHDWTSCDGLGGLETKAAMPRREALALGLAGAVWWLGAKTAWAQASFQAPESHDSILVVLFLRGGCDGLNTVAPYAEDFYYKERPTLALRKPGSGPGSLIDLDGFFGLHPSMQRLEARFKEGSAAFIQAVGSQDQTRSHFEAMSAMERGIGSDNESAGGGWLGRHLVSTPGRVSPMRAVALSSVMPDSLGGALGALAIERLSDYRLNTDDLAALSQIEKLYRGDDVISQAGRDTVRVLKALNKVDPRQYRPENGAAYPDSPLARAMRECAFLIKQDLGLEVACLDMGGWDTHVAQGAHEGWHAGLLGEVAGSVDAFLTDLGSLAKRVTVVVQTEFGRRIDENSGFGTDHGRAGVMAVLGAGVKGGKVCGEWPTLAPAKREGPGDLRVTTDYRDVLGEILASRLPGAKLDQVFPGHKVRPLGLMA